MRQPRPARPPFPAWGAPAVMGGAACLAAAFALAGPPHGALLGPGWTPVRLALGVPAVLLLPGYALIAALLPRADALDAPGRFSLAIGLSVAQVSLCALALSHSAARLTPLSIVVSIAAVTLAWCVVAAARGASRFAADTAPEAPLTSLERTILASCAGLAGACAAALLVVVPRSGRPAGVEFFMLGRDGRADSYPQIAVPNQPVEVQLAVTNDDAAADFLVVALRGDALVGSLPPFSVAGGATWTGRVALSLPAHGFSQRVDILLFRTDHQAPHRRLRFVVDVPPPGAPSPVRPVQTAIPRP